MLYRCSYRLHCDTFLDTAQVRMTCYTITAVARSHWSSNVDHDSPERFKAHTMQTLGKPLETLGKSWETLGKPLKTLEKPLGNPWETLGNPWKTLGKPLGNPGKTLRNPLGNFWKQ